MMAEHGRIWSRRLSAPAFACLLALTTAGLVGAQDQPAQGQTPAAAPEQPAEAAPAEEEVPAPEPTYPVTVTVGAYVNDIQQLDLTTHSYNMDFYLWFRWTEPAINPSATLEFMNSFQLWGHILTLLSEEPEQLADGSYYMALRTRGNSTPSCRSSTIRSTSSS